MSYRNLRISPNEANKLAELKQKVEEIQQWLIANISHPDFAKKLSEQRIYLLKIAKIRSDCDPYKPKIHHTNIIIHPVKQV